MPLTLHVDAAAWRAHLAEVLDANPGLVPVIKGNGYGFGVARLAAEARRLRVPTVAVGVPAEVSLVRQNFDGDIVVLEPWHPALSAPRFDDPRVIRTLAHPEAVAALAGTNHRVLVELRTAMQRHGFLPPLPTGRVRSEGYALHLPLEGDGVAEAERTLRAAGVSEGPVWVSHLLGKRLAELRRRVPGVELRPRVGTALWLGDRSSFRARSTVIDVHELPRGTKVGYRQHRMIKPGYLLVLAGGTAHGIALEAPKPVPSLEARAKVLATGTLGAAGLTLSPFTIDGRQRWFAEPPHMQVSLVLLAQDATPPAIGDEVPVEVRMTTATFDRVELV
ncbi:alanine racemase [Motilibacter rhizosphaerae]|uniref:Alanine racemase n=1 Tax=Motilibacter rhizosphaerae TaxID=598652 RepID=A0A4Q7NXQ1_9ACTN|nr:alanine racemase [Motilibacter rhizosphaerae]RZS91172.1 alanine racemase [Motilibacter rhizosphaerae]